MTNPPGRQTLQILLLLLGCMSVDKPWHTCMFGHSLADNFLESDGMWTAPVENQKSIFGHIKVSAQCQFHPSCTSASVHFIWNGIMFLTRFYTYSKHSISDRIDYTPGEIVRVKFSGC